MKKVLITGSTGLLGSALHFTAPQNVKVAGTVIRNYLVPNVEGVEYYVVDVMNHRTVDRAVRIFRPDVIVHTAAQANVDYCERHQPEAHDINVKGSKNIIKAANKYGATVIFCSTNSIYDGKNPPYSHKDEGNPVDYYGQTKVEIENTLKSEAKSWVIVRLMTMIGWNNPNERTNPVSWMIPKLKNKEELNMADDMYNNFLLNASAAEAIWKIITDNHHNEVFNLAGKDRRNRFELASFTAEVFQLIGSKINPVPSSFFTALTPRPLDTCFDVSKMEQVLNVEAYKLKDALKWMKSHQLKDSNWHQLFVDYQTLSGKIVLITHAVMYEDKDIHGPAHSVSNFLKQQNVDHYFIRHPLSGNFSSKVDYISDKGIKASKVSLWNTPILRYIAEIFWHLNFYRQHQGMTVIGVDPLNTLPAIIAKYLGWTKKVVYFSADYAVTRFDNPILNWIYQSFDKWSAINADYCWSVSSRIVDLRLKQGVSRGANLHIPNAPEFDKVPKNPIDKINKYDLVLVSNLNAGIEFNLLFKTLKKLSDKKYPKMRLIIIGGGEGEAAVKQAIKKHGVEKKIIMLGRLPHDQVHKVLSESGVGIALYNDNAPWRWYSDSMKARDYMAAGLPVIISGDTSTTYDIQQAGAGREVRLEERDLTEALTSILDNDSAYKTARENAIRLAKQNDITQILSRAVTRLLS